MSILFTRLIIVALCALLSGKDAFAQDREPADVYFKAQNLSQGLVSVLRQNLGTRLSLPLQSDLLLNDIQPRHVFQLALDIEAKLIALMRANGMVVEESRLVMVQPYSPSDVFSLMDKMDEHVARMMALHKIDPLVKTQVEGKKTPEDVFHLLERMDKFLLKMGAPSVQPGHVLRRAKAIAFVAEKLCSAPRCQSITPAILDPDEIIVPLHVYVETYRFISALADYVKKENIPVSGGVLALKPEEGLITPADANKVMGMALADVIDAVQHKTGLKKIELPRFSEQAMPRDVWREINYARRLLDVANAQN